MTETTNLHLPQFAASGRIHHDDFNDAFAAIDTAGAAAGNCSIATSYTGDGQYGSVHPNSLTFPFPPKMVAVMTNGANFILFASAANWTLFLRGVTEYEARYANNNSSSHAYHVTWSGNSLSWYGDSLEFAGGQLNESDQTYYYVAIG